MSKLVKLSDDSAINIWNALALNNTDELTISHDPALFQFFADHLKLSPLYFIIHRDNDPIGLLPLIRVGKKFISMPHFSYGGILWKAGEQDLVNDEDVLHEVLKLEKSERIQSGFYKFVMGEEKSTAKKLWPNIEVRSRQPMFGSSDTHKVVHILPLKLKNNLLFDSLPSNLKRKINKSFKNGLKVRQGHTELLADFSFVYNRNMHQIGSPTLGQGFFHALMSTSEIKTQVFVAYLNKQAVGGSFVMWYDGYYENIWFSTLREYNKLYTSYLLHWEMIRHASELNAKVYSMGRSSIGSGVHHYKSQWPVIEKKIYFNNTNPSAVNLRDQKWMSEVWKRLPGFVVDAIGPNIAKKIY